MGEELKFQKLAEVELVEEAPEGAHPLIEVDGKIKRALQIKGSGSGIPVFDLTPFVTSLPNVENSLEQGILTVEPSFTPEEASQFINWVVENGAVRITLDVKTAFENAGVPFMEDGLYTLSQLFSVQHVDVPNFGVESLRGVALYSGVLDALYGMNDASLLSFIGVSDNAVEARLVFPILLVAIMG